MRIGAATAKHGGILEYYSGQGSVPQDVTVGPDGFIWFTDTGNNAITQVRGGSAMTSYTIPTASSTPIGIITLSKAMWFAESAAGKIGSVTTAGKFNEYVIPTTGSGVLSLAADPNGFIWFTEPNTNKIGELQ